MPENYYDTLEQIEILELKCKLYESSERNIVSLSQTFRIFGNNEFADLVYQELFRLADEYDANCKEYHNLTQIIKSYKEIN